MTSAEQHFEKLIADAKKALAHRVSNWQPADPDRLAEGLQLAREGKTIKAEVRVVYVECTAEPIR